jgi:hypothetical protein
VNLRRQEYNSAEEYFQSAMNMLETKKTPMSIATQSIVLARSTCKLNMILLRCKQGRVNEGRQLCERMFAEQEDANLTAMALEVLTEVATFFMEHNDVNIAERLLERAYSIAREIPDHPDAVALLQTYALLLERTDRVGEIQDMRRFIRPILLPVKT